jgi:hypothetical protein
VYGRNRRVEGEVGLANGIQHIFVLMLENRSFDHMLGFSGITGTDAFTGRPTSVNGLVLVSGSLLQLARSLQTNTVSGIVLKEGKKWPPPPAISVRSLFTARLHIPAVRSARLCRGDIAADPSKSGRPSYL